jgi:hypothetical protein
MTRPGFALLACALALSIAPVADAQTTQRVRGTITAFEGDVLSIKTREGTDIKVELTGKASVATAKALTLADLKQGDYVGATTKERADGVLVAVEVHTLPRSVGEGHRPWDLEPGTMMTNASIAAMVQAAGGQQLTLQYKDGSKKILVPPGTPIATTTPADRTFLKPGEYVFMSVNVGTDGKLTSSARIQVSRDGVRPPQ